MSYYLFFRKGGVNICNFCRVTELFRAFDGNAPWDKWEVMDKSEFQKARDNLKFRKDEIEDNIDTYTRLFEATEGPDRVDYLLSVKELEKDLELVEEAYIQLNMLENIWEETSFDEEGNSGPHMPTEWGIF